MRKYLPVIAATISLAVVLPVRAAETTTQHVSAIQTRGDSDIQARVTSLNALVAAVNKTQHLSASEKTTVVNGIQNQVASLGALKQTLDNESTVDTSKTDFQDIFSQHYIYAFYLPTTERVIAADSEGQAASTLTNLVSKLQGYINAAKAQGDDVTTLQSNLNDMQTKAADATAQTQTVIADLSSLSASGYPGNKAVVQDAATTVKNIRTELAAARADAATIVAGLKKDFPPKAAVTATPSPSSTATVAPTATTALGASTAE